MRTWKCPECGHTEDIDYDWLAQNGEPVCGKCDCDMELQPEEVATTRQYTLTIDGKTFRAQRELLIAIVNLAQQKQPYSPQTGDDELLEGLVNLTDAIADQAHDQHGIDCLLG